MTRWLLLPEHQLMAARSIGSPLLRGFRLPEGLPGVERYKASEDGQFDGDIVTVGIERTRPGR
jgi:hypothetical protein